jgi:hypothetical protein
MALQSSGAIKLSEIQTEFGGSNPISLSEYYAADVGVPASGEISIADFYGTSSALNVTVTQGSSTSASAIYYGYFINGSVSPTSIFGYDILYIYRRYSTSTTASAFWLYLDGASVPSNLFTSIQIQTSSGFAELLASSASTSQLSTARYWTWTESDFASTADYNDFITEWDGTGDVIVKVYA